MIKVLPRRGSTSTLSSFSLPHHTPHHGHDGGESKKLEKNGGVESGA